MPLYVIVRHKFVIVVNRLIVPFHENVIWLIRFAVRRPVSRKRYRSQICVDIIHIAFGYRAAHLRTYNIPQNGFLPVRRPSA